MKPSLNRTTIFKIIVHGIELHAACEKRENKQKNAKRKITLNYSMFINIKGSCQCLQIKTFMGDFSSVYCSILSKIVCTFLDDFL